MKNAWTFSPARIGVFLVGLYCMGLGVALSVIAMLGTSPISCPPYVISEILSVSVGTVTFFMNLLFILAQIAILRRNFKPWQLLQLPALFVFSAFIDFNIWVFSWLPITNYALQILWMIAGCLAIGVGIGILLASNSIMMPGDSLISAIASTTKKDFGHVKVAFDVSLVLVAGILSIIFLHGIFGIREGSLIAALTVGIIARTVAAKLKSTTNLRPR